MRRHRSEGAFFSLLFRCSLRSRCETNPSSTPIHSRACHAIPTHLLASLPPGAFHIASKETDQLPRHSERSEAIEKKRGSSPLTEELRGEFKMLLE